MRHILLSLVFVTIFLPGGWAIAQTADLPVEAEVQYQVWRMERPNWRFQINPGILHFEYSEPEVMSEVGNLWGAGASASFEPRLGWFVTAAAAHHRGATRYSGALFSLTSHETIPYESSSRNSISRFDLGLAYEIAFPGGPALRPGLNFHHYRLWNPKTDIYSYDRSIVQSYLNPELAWVMGSNATSLYIFSVGYLIMLDGQVETGPAQAFGPLSMDQDSGLGLQASAAYERQFGQNTRIIFKVAGEWRNINASAPVAVRNAQLHEPPNRTLLLTFSTGLVF